VFYETLAVHSARKSNVRALDKEALMPPHFQMKIEGHRVYNRELKAKLWHSAKVNTVHFPSTTRSSVSPASDAHVQKFTRSLGMFTHVVVPEWKGLEIKMSLTHHPRLGHKEAPKAAEKKLYTSNHKGVHHWSRLTVVSSIFGGIKRTPFRAV